ncbi:MAG: 4Fe-4S dicluster domain-containing protein [Oscillospiraceae bacterium]|nr:4Fe-4S dicluster domain-containing protein [Oscillospiraceae bacterium]
MRKNEELAAEVRRISGVNPRLCMKCGKCSATCPAFDEMDYHPHQFVDLADQGRVEELMDSRGIWNCLSCFACLERCPRMVEPARLIEAVRLTMIRRQDQNHLKPQDIPALLDEDLPQQAITSAFRKYAK